MELIRIEQLCKSYGKNEAVKGISFTIEKGKCITLLGPNGAGKTTTLSMLAGLLEPTSGSIEFVGLGKTDYRQFIGYLPQYPAFYNWMSGYEFLEYVGKLSNLKHPELHNRIEELMQLVGLYEARKRKIGAYSGGMKQRLGLAQALIHHPKLLILDEPVSALDPIGRREVIDMIKKIKQETTVLFSTHVLHDAEEVSEDILIMNRGEIILAGGLKDLIRNSSRSLIRIETDNDPQFVQMLILSIDNVDKVDFSGEVLDIYLNDLEKGRKEILKKLVEHDISLRSFEVATTTLEDLFLKVVGA